MKDESIKLLDMLKKFIEDPHIIFRQEDAKIL
jgi:hypothetical protein